MANQEHSFGSHLLWTWSGDLRDIGVEAVVVTDDELGYMRGEAARHLKLEWGEEIEDQSVALGPHRLGTAWSTHAGPLASVDIVIHCAAMNRGGETDDTVIRLATEAALREGEFMRTRAVAFSALGTGKAGFPMVECGRVMATTMARYFSRDPESRLHNIVFVLLGEQKLEEFQEGLRGALADP